MFKSSRKTQSAANINSLVSVNDRIQLEIRGKTYASRIEDVQADELHVSIPYYHHTEVIVGKQQSIRLCLFAEGAVRMYSCTVKNILRDRVPIFVVSDFCDIGLIQRRDYVRILDQLYIRYGEHDGHKVSGQWIDGMTRDISGGGLQISGNKDHLSIGNFIEAIVRLPGSGNVRFIARVVRMYDDGNGSSGFAVQFIQIDNVGRKMIVQHVMKKQSVNHKLRKAS